MEESCSAATKVKSLKVPDLYSDCGGLYLQVTSSSTKSWIYRYALDKLIIVYQSIITIIATLLIGVSANAMDVSFTDISNEVGLAFQSASFGASWGDFDRDGNPDIFFSRHWSDTTAIFRNNGATFDEISATVNGSMSGDLHGGAWGDFDNDGDLDLAISTGANYGNGQGSNRILERRPSGFVEVAATLGLQFEFGRGRTPLWFDWNNDGKLDLLFTNVPRNDGLAPTTLFTQTSSGFEDSNAIAGLMPEGRTSFSTLIATGPLSPARLLIQSFWPFPGALYDYTSVPFVELKDSLGLVGVPGPIHDIVSGDFDNDQQTELYLTRTADPMTVRSITTYQARAWFRGVVNENYGLSFSAPGHITIAVGQRDQIAPGDVKIGSAGIAPSDLTFDLNSTDISNWGEHAEDPTTAGLFVHYDRVAQLWYVQLRAAMTIGIVVDSFSPLENLQSIGIPDESTTNEHVYLDQAGQVFVNATAAAGVNVQRACRSSATADFDNGMDLDIYLVCSDQVGNLPNVMLENNGAGVLTSVVNAAGAIGAVEGLGDAVALADYDSDGFVDILITNGAGPSPLSDDGPTQLYRNAGNANHWLEIELRGIVSNSDGIGTNVVINAGGVTQYRLQSGDMHKHSQNHSRLHFGLGSNDTVESIEIHWPSGIIQVLNNVPANQVLDIVEILVDNSIDVPIPAMAVFALFVIMLTIRRKIFAGRVR